MTRQGSPERARIGSLRQELEDVQRELQQGESTEAGFAPMRP